MSLPVEIYDRLIAIGETQAQISSVWGKLWTSESEQLCRRLLTSHEQTAAVYAVWFPKLKAFAAACRESVPAPEPIHMSVSDREKRRILLDYMQNYRRSNDGPFLRKRPNRAVLISTIPAGLQAAAEIFEDSDAIVMLTSECERWHKLFEQTGELDQRWLQCGYWYVHEIPSKEFESPFGTSEQDLRESYPIQPHEKYWVVEWGAGSIQIDIWKFDGRAAEFIANHGMIDF